jgi:hypothetical protein
MDIEVKNYYNIVELWTDERDVGNYLFENKIRYDLRVEREIDFDIDMNWMATRKDKHFAVYTVQLTEQEALFIGLSFPNLHIHKPVIKESIDKMAKRILCL